MTSKDTLHKMQKLNAIFIKKKTKFKLNKKYIFR